MVRETLANGLARSIFALMDLALGVPDHTTLARRRRTVSIDMHAPGRKAPVDLVLDSTGLKFYGPGEWARKKHGEKRRDWRKLHVSFDAGTGEILSHALTGSDTSDAVMASELVAKAGGGIRSVIADGAYYGAPVTTAICAARPPRSPPKIVRRENDPPDRFPIRLTPAAEDRHPPTRYAPRRNRGRRHAADIAAHGRIAWQKRNGYGKRSHAETAISRLKSRGGATLRSRTFGAQSQEITFRIAAANKAIRHAKPTTVRVT